MRSIGCQTFFSVIAGFQFTCMFVPSYFRLICICIFADNSQITGWLGQVPMFEAISKRNAITDLLKKLSEENKGLYI